MLFIVTFSSFVVKSGILLFISILFASHCNDILLIISLAIFCKEIMFCTIAISAVLELFFTFFIFSCFLLCGISKGRSAHIDVILTAAYISYIDYVLLL